MAGLINNRVKICDFRIRKTWTISSLEWKFFFSEIKMPLTDQMSLILGRGSKY